MIRNSGKFTSRLCGFEDHGISFEAAVETCISDIEEKDRIKLAEVIFWHYSIKEISDMQKKLVKRGAMQQFGEDFIDKIRDCANWDELQTKLDQKSKFSEIMKSKIREEIRQCKI